MHVRINNHREEERVQATTRSFKHVVKGNENGLVVFDSQSSNVEKEE